MFNKVKSSKSVDSILKLHEQTVIDLNERAVAMDTEIVKIESRLVTLENKIDKAKVERRRARGIANKFTEFLTQFDVDSELDNQ